MSDVSGEFMENCGFEGKILREVSQPCAPCDTCDTCDTTTSEQLAEIEGQATLQVREGRWRTRHGAVKNIRACEPLKGAYYVWPWTDGIMTFQDNGMHQGSKQSDNDLVEYLGPIEPDKTQELPTKTQEPDDKTQELPAQYTPPEGWRLVRFGELLLPGDEIVQIDDGRRYPTHRIGDAVGPNQQYIRLIGPQPGPQPEPQPVKVREGRWRTRGGQEFRVTAMPTDHEDFSAAYPWWDGDRTWSNNGNYSVHENAMDLVQYLGPIEQQPEPQPQAATIEELRSEVSYVQNLLGESRQRVTTLEKLVTSLRTINEAQEKAFDAANKANDDLQHRLNTVAAEWSQQAETIRCLQAELAQVSKDRYALQVELDAAQQVPADSPELRQLRLDLAEATRDRDQYLDSYQRIFGDLETIRETTKAETVEAIVEWLQAFRGCNSPALALLLLEALPSIMRSLVGLTDPEEIE